ncbi:MAG: hypothetical protein Q4B13_02245 [Lautropia sp.]|nr:hypothetical protein [Lautropia sp.]
MNLGFCFIKNIISSVDPVVDFCLKLASIFVKLSVSLGFIEYLLYSFRIGYFPQGMTIGDGFLFIAISGCFGAFYVVFLSSMVSIGILMSWILRPVLSGVIWCVLKKTNNDKEDIFEFLGFSWLSIPYSFVGLCFSIWLARDELVSYLIILLIIVMLFFLFDSC